MPADGSQSTEKKGARESDWATDTTVLAYQKFARGYGPTDKPAIVDHIFILLPWHKETSAAIKRSLSMSEAAKIEHCIRNEGPSRAGKTSAIRSLVRADFPRRTKDGLYIPFGYHRLQAIPSVLTLGQGMLRAMGDPTWPQRRNPAERVARIGEVSRQVGLKAFALDDLHHLVDSRGERVQHAVADFLIDLTDEMRVPFIFSGLERMSAIFSANEQLRGRTGATVEYARLDWKRPKHRDLFHAAVGQVLSEFSKFIKTEVSADDDEFLFRLYCSVGGLMGYLILVFRVAEHECRRLRQPLGDITLRKAVTTVVAKPNRWPGGCDPFSPGFVASVTDQSLAIARSVGTGFGPAPSIKEK